MVFVWQKPLCVEQMESEQAATVPGLGSSSPAVPEVPGDPAALAQR